MNKTINKTNKYKKFAKACLNQNNYLKQELNNLREKIKKLEKNNKANINKNKKLRKEMKTMQKLSQRDYASIAFCVDMDFCEKCNGFDMHFNHCPLLASDSDE
jgi:regulator of replication initiation timing